MPRRLPHRTALPLSSPSRSRRICLLFGLAQRRLAFAGQADALLEGARACWGSGGQPGERRRQWHRSVACLGPDDARRSPAATANAASRWAPWTWPCGMPRPAAGLPLHRFLARRLGLAEDYPQRVPVYAGGGYLSARRPGTPGGGAALRRSRLHPRQDQDRRGRAGPGPAPYRQGAAGSRRRFAAGGRRDEPLRRGGAVDAAKALAPLGLWWFEDICDPTISLPRPK